MAGLLAVYVLWLGLELQIFGVKTGYQLGVLEGLATKKYGKSILQPKKASRQFEVESNCLRNPMNIMNYELLERLGEQIGC